MRRKTFKYRIYPTANQERELLTAMESHRRIYNEALGWRQHAYETHKATISFYDLSRWFTKQRQLNPFWKRLNVGSVRATFKNLDKAFQGFFRRVKKGEKPGYPRFKGQYNLPSMTFCYGDGAKLNGHRLRVQYVGNVRVRLHRPVDGKIKQATVNRTPDGKWYVCFSCEVEHSPQVANGPSVGIDVGLSTFATLSNGEKIDNPRFLKNTLPELRRQQRSLARKTKGSNNRAKQRLKVARLHAKVGNQRRDFHFKTASTLTKRFGAIAVESLNIQGMMKNHRLARSIADVGWASFIDTLRHKADWAGVMFEEVNARGTTQECHKCGTVVKKSLSDRVHKCPTCKLKMCRDHNAALNILDRMGPIDVNVGVG